MLFKRKNNYKGKITPKKIFYDQIKSFSKLLKNRGSSAWYFQIFKEFVWYGSLNVIDIFY